MSSKIGYYVIFTLFIVIGVAMIASAQPATTQVKYSCPDAVWIPINSPIELGFCPDGVVLWRNSISR
jgi:hypothetical protein